MKSSYKTVINNFIQRIFQRSSEKRLHPSSSALDVSEHPSHHAHIIPRAKHSISRKNISRNALKVLYRLNDAGYQAHLVGGGVRDLLLDRTPKDFDIATNAKPEEVKSLFRNCRLIGRRFRLAHVHFGPEIIEVATFRAQHDGKGRDGMMENGRIVRDNVYGSLEDDAWRRDFTINSLYYNIADFSVVDYTSGMADIQTRTIRLIGDPIQRYREDPVRLLRAVRFRAKLGFGIEKQTEAPLYSLGDLLEDIPSSRLYEESLKLFLSGHAQQSLDLLNHYGLFRYLFPQLHNRLEDKAMRALVEAGLASTDQRVAEDKPVSPAFLFATLLWVPVQQLGAQLVADDADMNPQEALYQAANDVIQQSNGQVSIPRKTALDIREIWVLHWRMLNGARGKRALRLLTHPRFRAAYDFLCLRAQVEPELADLYTWWTELSSAEETERYALSNRPPQQAVQSAEKTYPKTRKPLRRRRRARRSSHSKTDDAQNHNDTDTSSSTDSNE